MFRPLTVTEIEVLVEWIDLAQAEVGDVMFFDVQLTLMGRSVIISQTQMSQVSERYRFSGDGWKLTFDFPKRYDRNQLSEMVRPAHIWQGDTGTDDNLFARDVTTWMMCREAKE